MQKVLQVKKGPNTVQSALKKTRPRDSAPNRYMLELMIRDSILCTCRVECTMEQRSMCSQNFGLAPPNWEGTHLRRVSLRTSENPDLTN